MNVWFTADTHFGHRKVAELRNFPDLDEHDSYIIESWNDVVKPNDTVWHLGDVGMNPKHFFPFLHWLNGTIHLVAGNHDQVWPGHRDAHKHQQLWLTKFASVQAFARRNINGRQVLLSHFPYSGDHYPVERYGEYRLHDEGKWLLHGHVHDLWKVNGRQINVGLDRWDLAPVSLEDVHAQIIVSEMML